MGNPDDDAARKKGKPPHAPVGPISEMLTPLELEALRREHKETHAYYQKAFAESEIKRGDK